MARGSKSKYSGKQKRKAEHIEKGYEKRGVSSGEAARRAWATVNKESGGGKKSGSGRGKRRATPRHEKAATREAHRNRMRADRRPARKRPELALTKPTLEREVARLRLLPNAEHASDCL